jgi:ABC-2 type transport system ATP-binding protein
MSSPVLAAGRDTVADDHAGPVLVSVSGLTRTYGTRRAVDGVSLDAGWGITGLLGPNGAGKTTLMRCIAGLSPWNSGRIRIAGIDLQHKPRAARERLGFMPERVAFPAEMRVADYLRFVCEMKRVPGSQRAASVESALTAAGLDESRTRVLGNLSKGYRQRVGLAQALLGDPDVLILDEPSAGLDPINVMEFRDVIRECARERAVLVSTHLLPEARMLCDRVVVMSAGRVVYAGATAGMLHAGAGRRHLRVRVGARPSGPGGAPVLETDGARLLQALPAEDGWVLVVEAEREPAVAGLVAGLVAAGWPVLGVEPTTDALEDAFRDAVVGCGEGA